MGTGQGGDTALVNTKGPWHTHLFAQKDLKLIQACPLSPETPDPPAPAHPTHLNLFFFVT